MEPPTSNPQSPMQFGALPNCRKRSDNLQSSSFTFSQNSLQAYVDCPRRFQLRYLHRLAWPAAEVQPILEYEQHLQRGQAFHKLVQQYSLGIPLKTLTRSTVTDPILAQWWHDFLQENPLPDDYAKYTEISLLTPIAEHRLVARYDMIAVSHTDLLIFDWKTNKYQPKQDTLQQKLQSRVYPFVLIQAGEHLNDGLPIGPDQVEMSYWFSNFPTAPLHFAYNREKYEADGAYLTDLISTIASLDEDGFPKTEDLTHCRYCMYRSFCDRGKQAGSIEDLETIDDLEDALVDDMKLTLDLDQIAEIEF